MGVLGQLEKMDLSLDLEVLREQTEKFMRQAGAFTYRTMKIPQALLPLTQLLSTEEDVQVHQLSAVLDALFEALYEHPLTRQAQKVTTYLRQNNLIPNEESTEDLIRYVINQSIARSPVPIPEPVVNEFWKFFHELFSEQELKGLMELNLDITRLVLKTYEPLLVELINILKETRRINQLKLNELVHRVQIIQDDLVIIRRQIRALRYIKPFFQTDPKDFHAQAKIVAQMVREFGPFFIKMAQVAAANADFLPEEISKELLVFQEDVPPMSAQEVLKAFEDCLGVNPYERYFGFDANRPIKSGSIGSVYLAKKPVMVNGKEVLKPIIIKVGRHNLDREFLMGKTVLGLAILSTHYWAPHSKLAPFLKAMQEQVDEFVKGFQRELDFGQEALIQQRFADRSKESMAWHVPEVHMASQRILEMEYLGDAVGLNHALKAFSPTKKRDFQRKVAERFLYTILMQMLIYQEFHGDLHPGNIMVGEEGQLFLIDWGNCVDMKGKWKPVWDYLVGALLADSELLTEALINISTYPEANRARHVEIQHMLEETMKKKQITPLNGHLWKTLRQEGLEGWQRRGQAIMHLMSNTQHLGLVVKSDYLHLSRSLFALAGSYLNLYEGLPKWLMALDCFKVATQFPLALMNDRFQVKSTTLRQQLWNRLPLPQVLKQRPV